MKPRRFVRLAILFLCVPIAAFADAGVDFGTVGGALTGRSTGFSLTGSTLVSVYGLKGEALVTSNNLDNVSFTIRALSSGSTQTSGTFGTGSTFTIPGNGTKSIPAGTMFSGTFSGPVTRTLVTLANGANNYTIAGSLTGSLRGISTNPVTAQLPIDTGKAFDGSTLISSGDTRFENLTVPEPGTLILLGTGLLGLAGSLRWTKKL